jgi:hypothetical protein
MSTLILPSELPALSIRQPFASLIASAHKTIEVRTWATNYRGPLLINASAKRYEEYPVGCTICIVDLVDVRPMTEDDEDAAVCLHFDGALAWVLKRPRPVPAYNVKGQLGLYSMQLPTDLRSMQLPTTRRPRSRPPWIEELMLGGAEEETGEQLRLRGVFE